MDDNIIPLTEKCAEESSSAAIIHTANQWSSPTIADVGDAVAPSAGDAGGVAAPSVACRWLDCEDEWEPPSEDGGGTAADA